MARPGDEWKHPREPGRWLYGDAWEAYPCERGELWACGGGLFAVADLALDDHEKVLSTAASLGWRVTATYTDPPWDKGISKGFRTKTFGKAVSESVDFVNDLMPSFVRVARGVCVYEMGIQHVDDLVRRIQVVHGKSAQVHPITYDRKHPCRAVSFSVGSTPTVDLSALRGYDDLDTVPIFCDVVQRHAGGNLCVWDPCTGLGTTPVNVLRAGHSFVGAELNPRRMAATLKEVSKVVGSEPVLMGKYLEDS